MTTDDELDDARVLASLGRLLSAGAPFISMPGIDPATHLPPAPTVDALRAPLEAALTELDADVAQLQPAVASLETLVEDGRLSEPNLESTIGSVVTDRTATASFRTGRRLLCAGDSNTNGTSSQPYRVALTRILGSAQIETYNGGIAGDSSAELLARFDTLLTASQPDAVFVMIGTNDLADGITIPQFQANIAAIAAKCSAFGVPVAFGAIAPKGSSYGSTVAADLSRRNLWLRQFCSQNGHRFVDTYGALVDPATGWLAAAYDDGGNLHWNNAGHLSVARKIATSLGDWFPVRQWPVTALQPGFSGLSNPLMSGTLGSGRPSGWGVAFGSATVVTDTIEAADSSLPAGNWYSVGIDNSAGGGVVYATRTTVIDPAIYSAGEELLIAFWVKDNGDGSSIRVIFTNNNVGIPPDILVGPGTATPGPVFAKVVVPATPNGLRIAIVPTVLAGQVRKMSIGACDVFNLSRAGLAGLI